MFRHLSLERVALALFAGALTLIAATMAFARPAILEEQNEKQVSSRVYQSMTCREAVERAEKSFNAEEGEVTFALFHDRDIGQSRHATLSVKNEVSSFEL